MSFSVEMVYACKIDQVPYPIVIYLFIYFIDMFYKDCQIVQMD